MAESGEGRIAGTTVALIIQTVRRLSGDTGVEAVLARAGETRSAAELEDLTAWSSYDSTIALLTAGAEVTGEPHLGRVVGEEMLLQYRGTEVAALLRSLGSPGEVLRNVAQSATKFSTATALDAVEVNPRSAIVEAWAIAGLVRHRMMCDYTAGVLSQAPVLFGMDAAEVVERTCQGRGDPRCTYDVRWDDSSAPDADPVRRIGYLEQQIGALSTRFEGLQATTTELVAAEDVGHVLQIITRRAGLAVRATHYVLAVRLHPSDPVRVEHRGFGDAGPPDALVAELVSDAPDPSIASRLVVDVATARQRFGRLAALYPAGSRFLPGEQGLLEAYAANAAAALEAAAALDEARRRHETADALLHLATAVAEVGRPQDMAQRIAEAIPHVVGGTRATVLLWDEGAEELRFAGMTGLDASVMEALGGLTVSRDDTPALGAMLADRKPIFIDQDTDDPCLAALIMAAGVTGVVVVPMASAQRFLGVVAAEIPRGREDDRGDLLERLAGVAANGTTALENGRLLEELQEQSFLDPLTGLANRRLLRDRIDQALACGARTGDRPVLVFLDLDHFKRINDSFGHATGDTVISVVAERLQRAVRRSDTVARIGGDEFAVLFDRLADSPDDAARLAEVLLGEIREPLVAGSQAIRLSASIGVVAATAGDDHDSLLRRADAAMYEAKATGRDAAVFA